MSGTPQGGSMMNDRDRIILIRDKEREYLRAAFAVYDREARDNEVAKSVKCYSRRL